MLRKLLTWGIVIFIAYYLFTQPTAAAGTAHHILNGAHSAATSLSTFLSSL